MENKRDGYSRTRAQLLIFIESEYQFDSELHEARAYKKKKKISQLKKTSHC